LSQARRSQLSPNLVHVPQLALQQISPTLHVFGPHGVLCGSGFMPHTACEHFCPGSTQVPQLALQHTRPPVHVVVPHGSSPRAEAAVAPVSF
jgi:hypothetical protein